MVVIVSGKYAHGEQFLIETQVQTAKETSEDPEFDDSEFVIFPL